MTTNKIVANALRARNADPDTVGVYSAAKKMIAAGAKHLTGYMWEIPEGMVHGANVIVGRTGGKVKVVRPSDRNGFVVAEVTDPLAQALERKGVMNALKAKNGPYDTLIIRKDPKYNNFWSIYQDGSANRAVPRVFDSPDTAKKYIKEYLPAWGDAKIRVKNSIATNADNRFDTASFGNNDVKCEIADYGKGPGFHISVYTDGLSSPSSWGDKGKKCINDAKTVLKAFERKASALKQAIAWMEQNAKKW